MGATSISVDIHSFFLYEVDTWADRIMFIMEELQAEVGPIFVTGTHTRENVDVLFLLYPPQQHEKIVNENIIGEYAQRFGENLTTILLAACGRDPNGSKLIVEDVGVLGDQQCSNMGLKTRSARGVDPEDIDLEIRDCLMRVRRWKLLGELGLEAESTAETVNLYAMEDRVSIFRDEDF